MTDREQDDFARLIEIRLAALEKCASDAIGSAHKCITAALASMDERLSKLEDAVVDGQLSREFNKPNG